MASSSVSVRVSDEVLEELTKRANAENKKVSDLVRELIESGLKAGGTADVWAGLGRVEELKQLHEQIAGVERLAFKSAWAAAKAQFLARMSMGFCADSARLIGGGTLTPKAEKEAFLAQTDEWAETFAESCLRDD